MILYFYKRKVFETRWVLWLFVASIFLAELATITGWWVAEFGRQPWIVWQLLRTADAVSPVLTAGMVFGSNIMFIALYHAFCSVPVLCSTRKFSMVLNRLEDVEDRPVSTLPDSFREVFREQPRAGG